MRSVIMIFVLTAICGCNNQPPEQQPSSGPGKSAEKQDQPANDSADVKAKTKVATDDSSPKSDATTQTQETTKPGILQTGADSAVGSIIVPDATSPIQPANAKKPAETEFIED